MNTWLRTAAVASIIAFPIMLIEWPAFGLLALPLLLILIAAGEA
jgi:hypothetical protein